MHPQMHSAYAWVCVGILQAERKDGRIGAKDTPRERYAAPYTGHSIALDGINEDEHGRSRDMLLIEAGEGEGIYLATFDLDALRSHRSCNTWSNAFGRPHRYHLLTSLDPRVAQRDRL